MRLKLLTVIALILLAVTTMGVLSPGAALADDPPQGSLAIQEIIVRTPEVEQGETAKLTVRISYSAPAGTQWGQWICLVGVLLYDDQGNLIWGDEGHRKEWEEYKRGVGERDCGADGETGTFTYEWDLPTDEFEPGARTFTLEIYGDQRTTGLGQPYWVVYHFTDRKTFTLTINPPTTEPTPTSTCDLELYVSPENLSAGEVAYLTLRALRGEEPIAGEPAQVAILDGPGAILEAPLTTDGYGDAEFIYQAPPDISEPTTVYLMGTVAGCPDDAATAFLYLQPAGGFEVEISPSFFNNLGDQVTIIVKVTSPEGNPISGETVVLELLAPAEEPVETWTDADGVASFTLTHIYEGWTTYQFAVRAVGEEVVMEIPVVATEVQLEQNPITQEPYIGVVADGVSTLDVFLHFPQLAGQPIPFTPSALGTLEGDAVVDTGGQPAVLLDGTGNATIRYRPPAYLPDPGLLTEQVNVSKMIDGVPVADESPISVWAAKEAINFTYEMPGLGTENVPLEILVFRTPVMLVHGFTGDTTTWAALAEYLRAQKFDAVNRNYPGTPQSTIMDIGEDLAVRIAEQEGDYARAGIKLSRVDVVAHSTGGLFTRSYIQGLSGDYRGDVRKLIMVGTPNHGVSTASKWIGAAQSWWYNYLHWTVLDDLHNESWFMLFINYGEETGQHLHPDVQYANLMGRVRVNIPNPITGNVYHVLLSEDLVIRNASSHLNGVVEHLFDNRVHAPGVPFTPDGNTPLTKDPGVWAKIVELLLKDIHRVPLESTRVGILRGEGEVYIRSSDGTLQPVTTYPIGFRPTEAVQTGQGRAVVGIYLNDALGGFIAARENTRFVIEYVSPYQVVVRMEAGTARFKSFLSGITAHYEVITGEGGDKWYEFRPYGVFRSYGTDFTVTAGPPAEAYVLEGEIVAEGIPAEGESTLWALSAQQGATVDQAGSLGALEAPPEPWWEDPFYEVQAAEAPPSAGGAPTGSAGPAATGTTALGQLMLCGGLGMLAIVTVGIVAVFALARRRPFARWLFIGLGITGAISLIFTCLAGFIMMYSSPQPAAAPAAPPAASTVAAPPTAAQPALPPPTALPPTQPPPPPQANTVTLTLINRFDQDVCYVHISPSEEDTWGDDWLSETETIAPEASRAFELTPGTYDLLAEDCDYNTLAEEYGVDIFEALEWTIGP